MNYNSIQRLFKVTVYVLRFIKFLRKKPVAQELSIVEIKWNRDAQNVLASEGNFPQWKTSLNGKPSLDYFLILMVFRDVVVGWQMPTPLIPLVFLFYTPKTIG